MIIAQIQIDHRDHMIFVQNLAAKIAKAEYGHCRTCVFCFMMAWFADMLGHLEARK